MAAYETGYCPKPEDPLAEALRETEPLWEKLVTEGPLSEQPEED